MTDRARLTFPSSPTSEAQGQEPIEAHARPHEDPELVRGTLRGRLEDFERLVERHQKALTRLARSELGDAATADDVVQATFVEAYVHLGSFRFEASFRSWLFRIAINRCRSLHGSRRGRQEVALDEVPEGEIPVGADPADRALRARLEREIERLPPRQRAVLRLRVFGDLPFAEVARIEGISEGSAKVSYHHAVKRLKEWLR
ncbi:MAG: RNA polymerase sigma factor [Candidatus Binatia bacterium]